MLEKQLGVSEDDQTKSLRDLSEKNKSELETSPDHFQAKNGNGRISAIDVFDKEVDSGMILAISDDHQTMD